MLNEVTVETLLERMLAAVPDEVDKRPSTVLYANFSAVAFELMELYLKAYYIEQNAFADTADREHLIRIAKPHSLTPYPKTAAKVIGQFNIELPLGIRFQKDAHFFYISKNLGLQSDGTYHAELTNETLGVLSDDVSGHIIPITISGVAEQIEGLQYARIIKIISRGENEESTEDFRKRYFNASKFKSYGGNIEDYKEMTRAIPGIGGVKVIPIWNGGGTVKLVITDSAYKKPSDEFLREVKRIIDPVEHEGKGFGLAPIDHVVTIVGPTERSVDIALNLVYEDGQNWELLKAQVGKVLEAYFSKIREDWEAQDGISDVIIVRRAYIETYVLGIDGIKDVSFTTLNGKNENAVFDKYELPVLGSVKGS